ncbi:hypothetical protein AGMMS50293_03020 [Spirochaetia bacterium]|nr:hypothetical protein AGMMS50293_03020 [Spirochaetia bacterium]
MIQMMSAYTTEVDEVEDALTEILNQLDLAALKKNSVGLVTCHFDFTDTGFIHELRKKLPFDIIGMTTMASANQYGFDMYALTLTVLTSDDVTFETAITSPLGPDNYRERIAAAYNKTCGKLPGEPSMIIGFFPYLKMLSGAHMVTAFDEICRGTPLWGSLATNIDISYERCYAFRNSDDEQDALAMLLMYGPVDPEFIVVSIPKQNMRENRGIITGSDGCILKEVNGVPALKYFESLGITIMSNATTVTPLLVYYEGSSEPVALGVYTINDDGSLLCGGEMTKGASIAIGEISADGIIATTGEGLQRLLQSDRKNGALLLPCVTRYVMLAPNQIGEMELVAKTLKDGNLPYTMAYAGGEVCPVRDEAGVWRNRFHNYTFSALAF